MMLHVRGMLAVVTGLGNRAMIRNEIRGRSKSSGVRAALPGTWGVVARPGLFERLRASERVAVVSAPAGSGKTVLLRSWINAEGLEGSAAWVSAGRAERDPQSFWLSVLEALRRTLPGSELVRELTPTPDLDGWTITELLLSDLASLQDRIWLIIDDLHRAPRPPRWRLSGTAPPRWSGGIG